MSIDYSVYVGPFVACKVEQVTATKMRTVLLCATPDCQGGRMENAIDAYDLTRRFCLFCGRELEPRVLQSRTMETHDSVDYWEVCNRLNGALMCVSPHLREDRGMLAERSRHLYVPNERTLRKEQARLSGEGVPVPLSFDPRRESPVVYTLGSSSDVERAVMAFTLDYTRELAYLREAYGGGKDIVSVRWGVLAWAS